MIPKAKLKIANLNYEYTDEKQNTQCIALKDVNLAVSEGEFVSIIGPSGCGKSTLLYVIDGLLTPKSGEIFIDGRSVSKPGRDRAMVFQSPSLLPWRTVLKNVVLVLKC